MDRQNRYAGDLPWGWWLRANGSVLEDGKGNAWNSVRDAYWIGEIRFPSGYFVPEQLEFLTRVLTSIDARPDAGNEQIQDLFDGNHNFWRFYRFWLASISLLDLTLQGDRLVNALNAPLSAEGRSVLLMLQATRDPEWERLPMSAILEAISNARRSAADDEREKALRAFERSIGRRRHVFARERLDRTFLITLTGIAREVRMPTMRVFWTQPFTNEKVRDDMFAWLAERIDRWDDWGEMAHQSGGEVLTRHLLALIVQGGATGQPK